MTNDPDRYDELTPVSDEVRRAVALNRKLATIVEASSDIMIRATADGRVDYVNPAGRGLLGLEAESALERFGFTDGHPAWARKLVEEEGIPAALAEGSWIADTALIGQDGLEFPVSQLIIAPRDPDTGKVAFLTSICRDITGRMKAAELLSLLQQEQELILDSVPALIFYKDRENRILRVNALVAKSLGLPKARIEGRHSVEFYPEHADRYYQDDLAVMRTGVPRLGIIEPYRLPSGEQRWIRTDKVPMKDRAGQVTGILVMASDITAQKRTEEALRISQADLNRAQSVARIGSWRMDVRQNCLAWSDEAYRIFGIPNGTPMCYESFMALVHPDDRTYVDEKWKNALGGDPYDIEHRIIVAGQVKWVREKAELEIGDRGEVLGGFGMTQDITERKQAEEALREADRHKDEFLAILAHELRNPLAPIKNAVQILGRTGLDESMLGWARDLIDRQVSHLTKLVDDLLDISRISRGTIELHPELVNLTEIVRQALETSRPLIESDRHRLALELPAAPLWVWGDPMRLDQVVSNLLTNASKYSEPQGRILVTVDQEGGEAVLRVKDTGIGIPPAMLEKIFEIFVQVDRTSSKSHNGLGIGLSLAKQIVMLHGGRIDADSGGIGKGSEFVVRLPVESAAEHSDTGWDTHAGLDGMPSYRVLVADDNQDASESLSMLLMLIGQEVRTARDGLEAVEMAAEFRPDLILMDIGMPELDGHGACRQIRARPFGRDIRIVALTGWGQEQQQQASIAAGFDQHLVKPIGMEDLERLLAALPRPDH